MTRPTLRPILLALFLGTVLAAARPPEAVAQDCPQVLALPDDQESLSCTIEDWGSDDPLFFELYTEGFALSERPILISGTGPIEVIFTLEERIEDDLPAWFELAVEHAVPGKSGIKKVGKLYRVLLQDPDPELMRMTLLVTGLAGESLEGARLYTLNNKADLKVIVRRLPMQCSMWARVTGDFTGTFFGDVAYYMHSTDGIMVDPEQMAMFTRLMGEEMAAQFGKVLAEEMQDPDAKEEGDENKGAEKFMLVLQDFKLDQETDDPLAVYAAIAGQFSLGITADLVPSEDPAKAKLLIDEVQATVGAIEGSGDRMLFESIEATGPEPALTILPYGGTDLAYGTFSGDLTTRGKYSLDGAPSRRLRVHIEANYTALKGQYTCAKR